MTSELSDLRSRLEALAEKWIHAAAMCNSTTAQEAWGEAIAKAAAELRALLAPPAPAPDCAVAVNVRHVCGASGFGLGMDDRCPACEAENAAREKPAPVAEPLKCEEPLKCPPLCKDCQHYSKAEHIMSAQFDICDAHAGEAGEVDLVRGDTVIHTHYCDSERDDLPGYCGPTGRLWKRRVT